MRLSQNFSKIWDVEVQKWHFLCSYVPHIYVSIQGNNTFTGSQILESDSFTCNMQKKIEKLT